MNETCEVCGMDGGDHLFTCGADWQRRRDEHNDRQTASLALSSLGANLAVAGALQLTWRLAKYGGIAWTPGDGQPAPTWKLSRQRSAP